MKLNRKKLRKMILKEIKQIVESQKSVGLPHKYSDHELARHAMNVVAEMKNRYGDDTINYGSRDYNKVELLLRIVNNAVQQAVKHHSGNLEFDYSTRQMVGEPSTSPEETEYMRQVQGDLKMARYALAELIGLEYRYSGGGRREALSQRMRELDPTGSKQRYGRFQPSDDPQLRRNMPEYLPGGRFYDPNDPIHKM